MADSDNSMSLPAVIGGSGGRSADFDVWMIGISSFASPSEVKNLPEGELISEQRSNGDVDPAIIACGQWRQARHVSLVLCRLQQRLERRMMNAALYGRDQPATCDRMDEEIGYSVALEAEVLATSAVLNIQDDIPNMEAGSLLGIVAKLEMVAGADREIDDPTDFPWPHIESILRDLKRLAGSLPVHRPGRASVREDAKRYRSVAAKLVEGNHAED
ncbi:hypothetical protein DOI34_24675 [Salmonella enterica subsp. enterica serovar Virchow]|nr:hypothetical protein [Salmonella enterica subsp. enterica serovar Virchow]ECD4520221.1 hypothetical protein [Salmonella enterica subsp. enterica serovar Virchow]EFG8200282.1 hypothetical protein [Escherichia coli]MIL09524.1 hypothetical protein [Salmonella enterica subsp. enterica serovar Enteritidis]